MQEIPAETPSVEPPEEPPTLSEAVDIFTDKIDHWWELGIENLPNLIAAVVVLVLFLVLSSLLKRIADKLLQKTPVPVPIKNLFVTILGVLVVIAGVFVALGLLGLDKTVASLLAGVGILGLALGFAFQDIASNFMAGVVISFRRPFAAGDIIESGDNKGVVDRISLRTTVLHRFSGEKVLIPNKDIISNPLVNFTARGSLRVEIPVGIAYGDDLEGVRETVLGAVRGVEGRMEDREVELFYTEFGDSSINFVVRYWIPFSRQVELIRSRSEAIIRIKRALDTAGYTIPFPIRTLDFSEVGGEQLSSQLQKPRPREGV